MHEDSELPDLPGVMTVKEVAKSLGISERMVHSYVQDGRLHGHKKAGVVLIKMEDFQTFQRARKGRPRTRVPVWRRPVGDNIQYMTRIPARIRPGLAERFDQKLEEMRMHGKHLVPGTVARYFVRDLGDPDDVDIVLVWRSTVMPPEKERQAALSALRAELADVLNWDDVQREGEVMMHT